MHFLPVFELMSDSLTTIWVEPLQCPSHQSILLTQEPIHEIFTKKYWELAELENDLFFRRPFWIFFSEKKKNFLYLIKKTKGFHMRYHFFRYYWWFLQNLRKNIIRTNMHTTVVLSRFLYAFFVKLLAHMVVFLVSFLLNEAIKWKLFTGNKILVCSLSSTENLTT